MPRPSDSDVDQSRGWRPRSPNARSPRSIDRRAAPIAARGSCVEPARLSLPDQRLPDEIGQVERTVTGQAMGPVQTFGRTPQGNSDLRGLRDDGGQHRGGCELGSRIIEAGTQTGGFGSHFARFGSHSGRIRTLFFAFWNKERQMRQANTPVIQANRGPEGMRHPLRSGMQDGDGFSTHRVGTRPPLPGGHIAKPWTRPRAEQVQFRT